MREPRVSEHALEVLEFRRVLERVAARAGSDLARDRILAMRPETDAAAIARELARVGAAMRFVEEDPAWGMPPVPDLTNTFEQLSAEGVVLEPKQLHSAGVLLNSSRRLSAELVGRVAALESKTVSDSLVNLTDEQLDARIKELDALIREMESERIDTPGTSADDANDAQGVIDK